MNKIKDKIKNVLNFTQYNKGIFVVPLILLLVIICCYTKDDGDCYFLYENGREILTNGIPYYDWMSMHEGLHIVLQQWIVSVIDFVIWDNFGEIGIQLYVTIVLVGVSLSFTYLLYLKTNNVMLAFILAIFPIAIIVQYTSNARPQIWTLLFIIWTIIFINKYAEKRDTKYLLPLIILSLCQANFHSTFWTALVGIIFVYFLFIMLKDKRFDYKLFLIFLACVIVGFINPYGLDALISPYLTIGHKGYTKISELMPPQAGVIFIAFIPTILFFTVSFFLRRYKKRNDLFIPDAILMTIVFIYSMFVFRTIIFYLIYIGICCADVYVLNKTPKVKEITKNDKIKTYISIPIISILLILSAFSQFNTSVEEYHERREPIPSMQKVVDFLDEYDPNIKGKTVLSTELEFGNFAYNKIGMSPYMDGRLEVYIINFNKKFDYFKELIDVRSGGNKETVKNKLNELIEKYKFDYLVFENDSSFNYVLDNNNYELIFDTYDNYSGDKEERSYSVYKRI